MLFICRKKLVKIFQAVDDREQKLQNLDNAVKSCEKAQNQNLQADEAAHQQKVEQRRTRMIKTKIGELEESTAYVTALITKLLNDRKIFGTKFIYNGIDYLLTISQEQKMLSGHIADLENNIQMVKNLKKLKYTGVILEEAEENGDTERRALDNYQHYHGLPKGSAAVELIGTSEASRVQRAGLQR